MATSLNLCDLCNKPLQYGEVVIAYHNLKTGTYFVECRGCASENLDGVERENVVWEVHEYGKTIWMERNPKNCLDFSTR